MAIEGDEFKRTRAVDVLVGILVFGSLWGLSEVALGGAIRAVGLPYQGGILIGLAMFIMGIVVGAYRRPAMLAGIAVVTILCKQLVVPILHVSIMCKANSCVAVMLQGLALAGVASVAGGKLRRSRLVQIASGASAAFLSAIAFFFVGMRVAPCRYLLSFNRPDGLVAFLAVEGLGWAIFSAVLFPIGYLAGTRLRDALLGLGMRKPVPYYSASAVLVILCWVASALAIAAGF